MGAGLAARRLARTLLQDAWPNTPGGVLCAIQSSSYGCGFDKHAALAALDADTPKRRDSTSGNGVSTQVLVIVLVICTMLTVVCVAGTLWALHRRHRRIEAQRRRAERRRQREKEEAAGNELRQVVIPVIVLGPCGEQLQVAFDDGYLEQVAAAEAAAAAECADGCCEGSGPAVGPAACDNAPGSMDGSSHGGGSSGSSSSSSSSPAAASPADSVAEHLTEEQPNLSAPAPSQPATTSGSSGPGAAAAAAGPPSLVQRVACPASLSVLSVADVAALYRQGDC